MTAEGGAACLVELRVLDGPNLYFTRPAIKLTLDVEHIIAAPPGAITAAGEVAGIAISRPGDPGSQTREAVVARLLTSLTRTLAARAGVTRLGVRARPADDQRAVVAFPWRHRYLAEALGEGVARAVDAVAGADLDRTLDEEADRLRGVDPGPRPDVPAPTIPTVAITGTNGKTTTTRLVAHMGRYAGVVVGWCNTDGIYIDGELIEAGDWSGFGGAGRVLRDPSVQLAVIEAARGGILLRGMGAAAVDVGVVTNISADHLGLHGIETLDQLAEVKATVVRAVRRGGTAVVNADDPRTLAMLAVTKGRPFVFGRDADSPGIRNALAVGGRAATILDGHVAILDRHREAELLIDVLDVPITQAGLSSYNSANALAATAAGVAIGLPLTAVIEGLRTFQPDPELNPGRMNVWEADGRVVIVDLAHNEDGLLALLEVARGLASPSERIILVIGTAGDRSDELLMSIGEIAGRAAHRVIIGEKERYLRGRDRQEMTELLRAGALAGGADDVPAYPTELSALLAAVDEAERGDVVGVMCQAQVDEVTAWLRSVGGQLLTAERLRARVEERRTIST